MTDSKIRHLQELYAIDESITDHAKLLTMPRYKAVIAAKDYKEACVQIQKCGYATDPKYAIKFISLIEALKLNHWDRGVTVQVVKPVTKPTVRTYQVKRGETLSAIAKANGTTVAALVKLNGIRDANLISVGLVVRLDWLFGWDK